MMPNQYPAIISFPLNEIALEGEVDDLEDFRAAEKGVVALVGASEREGRESWVTDELLSVTTQCLNIATPWSLAL